MNNSLWDETSNAIETFGHTVDDVDWVGGNDFTVPFDNFVEVASKTWYNRGFGGQEVAEDLVVAFKDGTWMSRAEYDGSEWWTYHCLKRPKEQRVVERLTRVSYEYTLKEMNEPGVEDEW